MKGIEITFQVYADNEEEVTALRKEIISFISEHAMAGRAVTATKLTSAIRGWKDNALVKNKIIEYFK